MNVSPLRFPEVLLLEPVAHGDARGFFMESYNKRKFEEAVGRTIDFVQDNHSASTHGVLRGLHYQLPPTPQIKLVRAVVGEIFDVAVDVRRGSTTFGQWAGTRLSADNRRQLLVPEGFAHGFVVLSERAEIIYKTSSYYDPACERAVAWNDPAIGIEWPLDIAPILSAKDQIAPMLADASVFD